MAKNPVFETVPDVFSGGEYLAGMKLLSAFIGCSEPTSRALVKSKKIPFVRIGRKYFFEKSKVKNAILKGGKNA